MRNVPHRVPYEKLAFSQPIKVRSKQMDLAQKIGKEEDEYLKDMNQFYLDYHNYEQKRLYFLQLKHIQSIMNQGKLIKSTFSDIFFEPLNQRQNNALKALSDPIIDNSELEKEVIALEIKVEKYRKALKQRSSAKYLFGDSYSSKYKENENQVVQKSYQSINLQMVDSHLSIESKFLQMKLQKEEKQMELQRRSIVLNQQIKSIDNELYRVNKILQLYKPDRYNSISNNYKELDQKPSVNYISEIQEAIINQRKLFLQEKNNDVLKMKEQIEINEKQNKEEYSELEKQFNILTEEMNIIDQLKNELFRINEEISVNKFRLLNSKNDYYDVKRKLSFQNEEIQAANQIINETKANIASKQALLSKKEDEINKKRKEIEQEKQYVKTIENELLTMKKLMELKQKNIHFIQNRVDSIIKGTRNANNPVKRLLRLDNLGIKKSMTFSNKPFLFRRNENVIPKQL